jgi:hypothetical protein
MIYLKSIHTRDGKVQSISTYSGERLHVTSRRVEVESKDDVAAILIGDLPGSGTWQFFVMTADGTTMDKFMAFEDSGVTLEPGP